MFRRIKPKEKYVRSLDGLMKNKELWSYVVSCEISRPSFLCICKCIMSVSTQTKYNTTLEKKQQQIKAVFKNELRTRMCATVPDDISFAGLLGIVWGPWLFENSPISQGFKVNRGLKCLFNDTLAYFKKGNIW